MTDTISHEDDAIAYLTIDGEEIETTPWHLFYTDDGWVEAEKLESGDKVLSLDGEHGIVEDLIIIDETQMMYDLTVAVVHTFAVGNGEWIVHNRCTEVRARQASELSRYADDVFQGFYNGVKYPEITVAAVYLPDGSVGMVIGSDNLATLSEYSQLLGGKTRDGKNIVALDPNVTSDMLYTGLSHAEQLIYNETGATEIGISNPDGPCGTYCGPEFIDKDVAIAYPTRLGGAGTDFYVSYQGISYNFSLLFGY